MTDHICWSLDICYYGVLLYQSWLVSTSDVLPINRCNVSPYIYSVNERTERTPFLSLVILYKECLIRHVYKRIIEGISTPH